MPARSTASPDSLVPAAADAACRWTKPDAGRGSTRPEGARLDCAPLAAKLGPNGCSLGELVWGGAQVAGQLLALTTPSGPLPAAEESYTRGADHVSVYPISDRFPFRTRLVWTASRVAPRQSDARGSHAGVAVTLSVSMQTNLLDTSPRIELGTAIDAASPWRPGDGLAMRDLDGGAALVVSVHPSDRAECALFERDQRLVVELRPPFLEKGVIRTFRVWAVFLADDAPGGSIDRMLAALAAAPPPLTA